MFWYIGLITLRPTDTVNLRANFIHAPIKPGVVFNLTGITPEIYLFHVCQVFLLPGIKRRLSLWGIYPDLHA